MADAGVTSGSGKPREGSDKPREGGSARVLMTLDGTVRDPHAPLLCADDMSVLRGDGVFETVLVRDGRPRLLDEHLDRLTQSARMLELPRPDLDAWRRTAEAAATRWGAGSEGSMRLVFTRGRESGGGPTAFVTVSAVPTRSLRVRDDGIAAITLNRGRSVDVAASSPWELAGAKSLSYATNMAAVRYAEKQGADDVLFVSAEGYVLEGPRATIVIARGGGLVTPPVEHGILPGTTQRALFGVARARGIDCRYAPLRPADLIAADGVWLMSSVALAATVHTINGVEIGRAAIDADLKKMVLEAIGDTNTGDAQTGETGNSDLGTASTGPANAGTANTGTANARPAQPGPGTRSS